jgi:hypothetical protein
MIDIWFIIKMGRTARMTQKVIKNEETGKSLSHRHIGRTKTKKQTLYVEGLI